MRIVLFLLLLSIISAHGLRVCTRRHYKVHSSAILQRVELPSTERCIERCIESMDYCSVVQFLKNESKNLGVCTLFKEVSGNEMHPDATIDPLSIVYELLDKCPPFSASDVTHKISKLHRDALKDDENSAMMKSRLADAFFPEKERLVGSDEVNLDQERYAVMQAVEEVEIEAAKSQLELPRDPFNDGPRFHQSSREISEERRRNNRLHRVREEYKESETPIKPVSVQRGMHKQVTSQPIHLCLPNTPCARSMYQLDAAPCPARQGGPCAPKRPCMSDDCYHVSPEVADAQVPAEWTEWTECSATCGLAIKTRQCLGGFNCPGPGSKSCNLPECESWTLWGPWTLCSASCGSGERQRVRTCQTGRNCPGPSAEVEACQALIPCPTWSPWSAWSGCARVCGGGSVERRTRVCQNGLICNGPAAEERPCDSVPCPHWSNWGPWDECSKSCGGGHTFRARECIDGTNCLGASEERLFCNQQPCPEWSQWTAWTVCDEKCGEESIRLRNRKCLNAASDSECDGPAQDQINCPYRECPKWEEWSEWSDCSTTCGQGVQKRNRRCDTANECQGPSEEMRFCQVASCPYWGDWSDWSGCSVSCGRGVCERKRKCITDDFLQLPSIEELEKDDSLEKHDAKEVLIARAKMISKGRHSNETRFSPLRATTLDQSIGGLCDGPDVETKVCDAGPCCAWNRWSEWSPCIGCGGEGISKRNRYCSMEGGSPAPPPLGFQEDIQSYDRQSYAISPTGFNSLSPIVPVEVHRGKRQVLFGISARNQCHCPGDSFQTRPCPEQVACEEQLPKCSWSDWSEWCGCSSCREGKETRRRYCDRESPNRRGPTRPDDSCDCGEGNDIEERECRITHDCFSSNESRHSRGRTGNSHRSRIQDNETRGEALISSGENRYVPIDSVIGRVQLESHSNPYGKKDSPEAFSTTQFPYKVCHWSEWSDWSRCHENRRRERKRFCVGDKKAELVSNCECIGKPHEEQSCRNDDSSQSSEDTEIENNLDKLLTTDDGEEDENSKTKVTSELGAVQCDWTRWSQWSVCTTTCGPGKRMRRRRCPCGLTNCGPGSDSNAETCENEPCSNPSVTNRIKPVFTLSA